MIFPHITHLAQNMFLAKGPVQTAKMLRGKYPFKPYRDEIFRVGEYQLPNFAKMFGMFPAGIANGGYAALLFPDQVYIPARNDFCKGFETLYALTAIGEVIQHADTIEANSDALYLNWDENTLEASKIFAWEMFLPECLIQRHKEEGWDLDQYKLRFSIWPDLLQERLNGNFCVPYVNIFHFNTYAVK